ncbi:MAG: hypothetical protein WBQ68_02710 [Terriglobales bacterium]
MPPSKLPTELTGVGAPGGDGRASPGLGGSRTRSHTDSADYLPFRNPEGSKLNLERVRARLSPGLGSALPALLREAPDPDGALLLFDRLIESSEIVRLLEQHHFLAHYAVVVFGHSRFLGETLIQNADLLPSFLRERNLDRSFSQEEFRESLARFRARSSESDVVLTWARFKRREYVRIMLRDVLKIAPLAETTAEISALADVLIEEALREADSRLQRRHGAPQHLDVTGRLVDTPFAVLALGKLGGNELNYSSDVDLMYIYGDGEEPPRAPVSNREYFIRLAQETTEMLSRVTGEGQVFRIDLRLRPQGGEGELAIRLSQALAYYSETAHDWERQALIKVRHTAGDSGLAREFIRAVQPHVYTEKVNFAAIKTALVAREKMQKRRQLGKTLGEVEQSIDVKIDRGGIRDIEFLVQCLQRVYGGAEPWLRSSGTLFSLHKLHDKGHISGKEFHDLTSGYEFLRHVEHRLQLREGQQTHRLPASEAERGVLRRAMEGHTAAEYGSGSLLSSVPPAGDLASVVRRRMAAVAEIYQRIIYQQQTRGRQEMPAGEFKLLGALEPATSEPSSQQIIERLATDAPALHEIANRRDLNPQARKNFYRFLGSAFSSSQRYGGVLRNQEAVGRALALFETSDYLSEILIRHPEEIVTLAELEEVAPQTGGRYLFEESLGLAESARDPVFAYLAESSASYPEKLALLRRHFRHRAFVAGARDVLELRGVYESFEATTAAAEDVMATAVRLADAEGLAVMGLGRLGSGEFDLLSDADVLFVCADNGDRIALTKAAEKMMHALSAYTRDGTVFSLDARLRPRGGEGELLSTPLQLAAYFEHEAHPWEALMYTKMRFLAGSQTLGDRASRTLNALFERFAADTAFTVAVREMRTKLEAAEPSEKSFKYPPGAIYDIDFIASFLLVKHRVADKRGSLRDRLWRCVGSGVLDKSDAGVLDHAAELLRTVEHVARLVVGRAVKWLPATEHGRKITEKLTSQILRREFPAGLESELDTTFAKVRAVYDRVVGG